MATFVRMPQKGLTEESAILSSWHIKEGDAVTEGQYIFTLETGKATFEVEAEVSGTILKILAAEGEEVLIKRIVCVIGTPGEAYVLPKEGGDDGAAAAAPGSMAARPGGAYVQAEQAPVPAAAGLPAAPPAAQTGKIKISPRARRLALAQGIDCGRLTGTGPGGRVIEEDVKAAFACAPSVVPGAAATAGEYSVLPFTPTRRAIAAAMRQSLAHAAQFTLHAHCDATELLAYRERCNSARAVEEKLTIGDLIAFAVSRTLPRFPHLNAHSTEDGLFLFPQVHLGIAVDTPRGLLVPVVRGAETKSLSRLSREIKGLVARCREGKAQSEELSGGTFTLSNMGARRVSFFTPILNPPQTGILGAGTIEYRRKMTAGGMADYPALSLSLTADHRVVDGVPAGAFLAEICGGLEKFTLLLV
ncbi:MAG: 2-oxo acid dehydrogenase subunit E2 [Spirochaetaceae bacterium]|nr:2-oxo acid dehydrogenase subunit E2 [Spirochaetaceae bacterium]